MYDVDSLLKAKKEALSVPYMTFNHLIARTGEKAVYYFIEGYDAPYYHPRIENLCDLRPVPIICSGKKNVLGVAPLVAKEKFKKYKKLFFVDSDFDDNTDISEEIYVTPCYAIENLYVNKKCLENVLMCEFSILPKDEEFFRTIQLFSAEIEKFHNAVLEFNAWYACFKKKNGVEKISLEDNFPKDFIKFSITDIQKNYDITKITKKFKISTVISAEELETSSVILRKNFFCSLRGKYQMQFFCAFLTFLIEDANSTDKRVYLKKKTKFQINRSLILSLLSQYAATPSCLVQYIKMKAA